MARKVARTGEAGQRGEGERTGGPGKGWKQRQQSRQQQRSGRQRQLWIAGGVAAVVIAAVVGYFAYQSAANLPGVEMPDQGNMHLQTAGEPHVPYNSDPPTSGPHLGYLAPWGVHTQPIPRELQVHNLEDGGVMVQYSCPSGCPELVDKLRKIVEQYPTQVILAPSPGLKQRIALTAWTRIDTFDEFDEARIQRFIKAYRGIDHHKR
ncbi:MAG TPA: DUF3105 domain-containing protein [Vicinamibacterales bacterium]|nr:DUF3105 domain-containing protein [Vicinamibacterales bacterium]